MGCSSCQGRAAQAAQYPREITLPDGSKVMADTAADERAIRSRAQQAARDNARRTGYSVSR